MHYESVGPGPFVSPQAQATCYVRRTRFTGPAHVSSLVKTGHHKCGINLIILSFQTRRTLLNGTNRMKQSESPESNML